MMFNFNKKRKIKKLKDFLFLLENGNNLPPDWYFEDKKYLINTLRWLIAYYEGRASSTPKELLETYINGVRVNKILKRDLDCIKLLYNWIYYEKILGF